MIYTQIFCECVLSQIPSKIISNLLTIINSHNWPYFWHYVAKTSKFIVQSIQIACSTQKKCNEKQIVWFRLNVNPIWPSACHASKQFPHKIALSCTKFWHPLVWCNERFSHVFQLYNKSSIKNTTNLLCRVMSSLRTFSSRLIVMIDIALISSSLSSALHSVAAIL